MAMYKAKEAGRNAFRFFTPEMDEQALNRMTLEHDLRHALRRHEFEMYFQPIMDVATGGLAGAEALVRWHHPERGMIMPSEFIHVAEDTGVILEIGEWIVQSSLAQAKAWRDEGLPLFWLSINLSSAQVKRGLTAARTIEMVARSGLPPEAVTFEITERLIMGDTKESVDWVRQVGEAGIGLSVDDFGTGYSSLSYLRKFPLNMVKIDKSFVRDIVTDPDDARLAGAVVALAHSLDLKAVGEGVETQEQLDFLRRQGCDYAQGFLFGRPMPPADFRAYLASIRG
jgi:EAL domain-containing protein (putative c-di-GMP-specific phosphodiesterase class I)